MLCRRVETSAGAFVVPVNGTSCRNIPRCWAWSTGRIEHLSSSLIPLGSVRFSTALDESPAVLTPDLERDGFDTENPRFSCYVAEIQTVSKKICKGDEALQCCEENEHRQEGEQQTELVGYALYYLRYSTWEGVSLYMEDLYVSPKFRGQGIGQALFAHVAKGCLAMGGKQLDFEVLDWNPAQKFYKKLGAFNRTEHEGWHSYRLTEEALERLAKCDTC